MDAPRFPNRATVRLSDALHLRLAALLARAEVYADEVEAGPGRHCSPLPFSNSPPSPLHCTPAFHPLTPAASLTPDNLSPIARRLAPPPSALRPPPYAVHPLLSTLSHSPDAFSPPPVRPRHDIAHDMPFNSGTEGSTYVPKTLRAKSARSCVEDVLALDKLGASGLVGPVRSARQVM